MWRSAFLRLNVLDMDTPSWNTTVAGRDPVSVAIEDCLKQMETSGLGSLERTHKNGAVQLRFGRYAGCADHYDIALMRLVGEMLDDLKYRPILVPALRETMAVAA